MALEPLRPQTTPSRWRRRGLTLLVGLLCVAAIPTALAAAGFTVPNLFSNGTVAEASQVNANFTALAANAFQIGDVKISILTEAQFQSIHGNCWALMDGRSIAGKDLAVLTGKTTIPDARGLFLRGKNNGRVDGKENPDGEILLGDYQADMYVSHVHQGVRMSTSGGSGCSAVAVSGYNGNGCTGGAVTATAATTVAAGGNETRVRNATVNYFIKIHNTCS